MAVFWEWYFFSLHYMSLIWTCIGPQPLISQMIPFIPSVTLKISSWRFTNSLLLCIAALKCSAAYSMRRAHAFSYTCHAFFSCLRLSKLDPLDLGLNSNYAQGDFRSVLKLVINFIFFYLRGWVNGVSPSKMRQPFAKQLAPWRPVLSSQAAICG